MTAYEAFVNTYKREPQHTAFTLNKHVNTVIGMAGITYLLLVGFLTQSRTFVLMIALLAVYLALVSGKNRWLYLLAIGNLQLKIRRNLSTKVVKIIQSYTGVVDKMVWRKY